MALKLSNDPSSMPSILNKWAAEMEARIAKAEKASQRTELGGFTVDQLTRKGEVNTSSTLGKLASTLPTLGGSFTYTSTTTDVTWNWVSLQLLYPNGTTESLGTGSNTITGLTAGTYYFYPYFSTQRKRVEWVVLAGTSTGTPAYAFAAKSILASQIQNLDPNIPLAVGALTAIVPGAGTGTGGGGGSGCIRPNQLIEVQGRGFLRADDLRVGDTIRAPEGWTEVFAIGPSRQSAYVQLRVSDGEHTEELETSVTHPFKMCDGTYCRAEDLSLSSVILSHRSPLAVVGLRIVQEPSRFLTLHCESTHEFCIGELGAATHNAMIEK
jgi:hypothetical protein